MQIKTSDSRFLKYGSSFKNIELLNNRSVNDFLITENDILKIYFANHDLFVSELDGIVFLNIGKYCDIKKMDSFILSKTIRIKKGQYFMFSTLSKQSHIRLYNKVEDFEFIKNIDRNALDNHSESFDITRFYFCSYSMKTAGYHFNSEKHACWEITYIDDGELHSNVDGKEYILNKGQYMFYVPNQEHGQNISINSNCSYLTITFETNLINYDSLKNKVFSCDYDTSSIFTSLINCTNEMRFVDDMIKLKIKELMIISCNTNLSNHKNKEQYYNDKLLNSIIDYINDHMNDDITVDYLCCIFGVSRTKIQKIFKSKLKTSPKDYIISTKLSYGKILLKQNKYSIDEVANMSGFSSANYFSRMFKKIYNLSPTQYIKRRIL